MIKYQCVSSFNVDWMLYECSRSLVIINMIMGVKSFKTFTKNESSWHVCEIAMHSTLQVSKGTEFCFLDSQLIAGPNPDKQKQPVSDTSSVIKT